MKASVIFHEGPWLGVFKEAGTPTIPEVVEAAQRYLPELSKISEGGLLHRLDTGTSGLVLFACTEALWAFCRARWKDPQGVRKFYRAVAGTGLEAPQTWTFPIGHHAKSAKRMQVLVPGRLRKIRGQPQKAVTHLLACQTWSDTWSDYTLQIETGVRHQIRCHLSAAGKPIVGDPLYQGSPAHRLWLHAWQIDIPASLHAPSLQLEAPLPPTWNLQGLQTSLYKSLP